MTDEKAKEIVRSIPGWYVAQDELPGLGTPVRFVSGDGKTVLLCANIQHPFFTGFRSMNHILALGDEESAQGYTKALDALTNALEEEQGEHFAAMRAKVREMYGS